MVDGAPHLLAREPAPLGEALGEELRGEGIELVLGAQAKAARRDGEDFVLELDDGRELRGDRLLVATGRRPRVERHRPGERRRRARPRTGSRSTTTCGRAERLWAIGDVNGAWPLTHVGKYEGEVVAANILGEDRAVNYDAVPRVTYTDPQAAAVGAGEAASAAPRRCRESRRPPPTRTPTPRRERLPDAAQRRRAADRAPTRSARRRGSGCSRRRWRSARTSRSTSSPTRSSRSRPSRRSTSPR